MIHRSNRSWMMIAGGMVVMACIVLGVLSVLADRTPLVRVEIPGSNLTLSLYSDDDGMHRYTVRAGGRAIAEKVSLGTHGILVGHPQVSILGDDVTITFRTDEHSAPFVEFDLARCRITRHSNAAVPPPPIRDCRKK